MRGSIRLNSLNSATNTQLLWRLPIFVGLLCTNLMNPRPACAADASLTPITAITKSMQNHEITVEASVLQVREPTADRAPYVATLSQNGVSLPLVYWRDMQPALAPKLKPTYVVRATVTVSVYRDRLELQIKNPDAVTVISPASTGAESNQVAVVSPTPAATTPSSTPVATVIGKIKADWADRVVTITGTISGVEPADKGQRLSVQDATGEITVVLGESIAPGVVAANL